MFNATLLEFTPLDILEEHLMVSLSKSLTRLRGIFLLFVSGLGQTTLLASSISHLIIRLAPGNNDHQT